jgi:2-haloacid dehalogenase
VTLGRRQFFLAGSGLVAALSLTPPLAARVDRRYTAIAFDAFTIFDTRSVTTLADTLFPGRGVELVDVWRMKQFEYAWLRSLSQRYTDFMRVTDDALVFAARVIGLELTFDTRRQLLNAYSRLSPWPEALPVLNVLKERGYDLAILSNLSPAMLDGCIEAGGLEGVFKHVISTDTAQTYKPDPRAYELGLDVLQRSREKILFVAYAGWDAAGAKAFGYPTFWVNRLRLPQEELGAQTDASGTTLTELLAFLES